MDAIKFIGEHVFDTHDEYPRLLAGAHRRRVTPIGAPALTRHVAFWKPASANVQGPTRDKSHSAPTVSETSRIAADPPAISKRAIMADEAIAALYRRLLALSVRKRGTRLVRGLTTNSAVTVDGNPLIVLFAKAMVPGTGVTVACPDSVRPDSYRALKIAFQWRGLHATLSFELHTEFFVLTSILDASVKATSRQVKLRQRMYGQTFSKLYEDLTALNDAGNLPPDRYKRIYNVLYGMIWEKFSKEILDSLGKYGNDIGKKFVDFRGVVVGVEDRAEGPVVKMPFSSDGPNEGTGCERKASFKIKDFDKQIWKFFTLSQDKDTEFTLSRFLGSRALYATALGNQAKAMLEAVGRPLCYLVYEDTLNNWQLGRLIYRIHRAGTARIAAIINFEELRKANQYLSEIELDLENANALLIDSHSEDDSEATGVFRTSLRHYYREVEQKLGLVAALHLGGTLEGRIERSRYYVRQFYSVTKALRIRRVSGYQRYDEFVTQRLGPVFEYIDALGKRYSRVQTDRSILLGRIQNYDLQYTNELIVHAQNIADLALSCVILPYYAGYVISHAFSKIVSEDVVWFDATIFGISMLILFYIPRFVAKFHPRPLFIARKSARFSMALMLAVFIGLAHEHILDLVISTPSFVEAQVRQLTASTQPQQRSGPAQASAAMKHRMPASANSVNSSTRPLTRQEKK